MTIFLCKIITFNDINLSASMITREQIKKEIDNLPDNLLEDIYLLLKRTILKKKSVKEIITLRNFNGRLDKTDIRKSAYE